MSLWQKESKAHNALYVNIFNNGPRDPRLLKKVYEDTIKNYAQYKQCHPWQKNDAEANAKRSIGNQFFIREEYRVAIENYNKSLCFAENGSETQGLAYANRSACFFQMDMFEKCLIDIDLALKANYPEFLMEKLEKRRENCYASMSHGLSVPAHIPALSYEPNALLPVLANVVNIDFDAKQHRRRLVAMKDLSVGETIFLEPSFVGESYAEKYTTCNLCLRLNQNLVPCKNCTAALFCRGTCEHSKLHQIECKIKPIPIITHLYAINIQIPLIRSIQLALQIFPTADELMAFVEKTMNTASDDIPAFIGDKSKYSTFLKLELYPVDMETIQLVYSLYHTMLDQPALAEKFDTEKSKRFLMHLVMHHILILKKNANEVQCTFESDTGGLEVVLTNQISILSGLFNHSCAPNVAHILDNGATAGVVLRPIKTGEELCINYGYFDIASFKIRQQFLSRILKIRCNCERCKQRAETLPENPNLSSDPDYLQIHGLSRKGAIWIKFNDPAADELKKKCIAFLNKHGRGEWSREIHFVISTFTRLLQTRAITEDQQFFKDIKDQMANFPCCGVQSVRVLHQ